MTTAMQSFSYRTNCSSNLVLFVIFTDNSSFRNRIFLLSALVSNIIFIFWFYRDQNSR